MLAALPTAYNWSMARDTNTWLKLALVFLLLVNGVLIAFDLWDNRNLERRIETLNQELDTVKQELRASTKQREEVLWDRWREIEEGMKADELERLPIEIQ